MNKPTCQITIVTSIEGSAPRHDKCLKEAVARLDQRIHVCEDHSAHYLRAADQQ